MASLGSRLLGVMRLFGMFGLFSEGGGVIGPHFVCVGRDLKPWQVFWAARASRVWGGSRWLQNCGVSGLGTVGV